MVNKKKEDVKDNVNKEIENTDKALIISLDKEDTLSLYSTGLSTTEQVGLLKRAMLFVENEINFQHEKEKAEKLLMELSNSKMYDDILTNAIPTTGN